MKEIIANMAGLVLKLQVKLGDSVGEGQDVVTLESMKMEVPIQSLVSGIVKEIKVNIGDFVNEGEILIVLE